MASLIKFSASFFKAASLSAGKIQNVTPLTKRWRVHQERRLVSVSTTKTPLPRASSGTTRVVYNGGDVLEISRVINGMWQTSGGWGEIDKNQAVNAMLLHADAGFTSFDMAGHYGPAEEIYGLFMNKMQRERGEEFTSKVQGLTQWVPGSEKMTRECVEARIDRSLKRMGVRTLDMLQFFWWNFEDAGYLDALKHLTDLKEEGKIKTLALCDFDTKALSLVLESGIPIVSNQVQHSLIDNRPQKIMSDLCQRSGVQLLTYGTVMGGLLSEKFLNAKISIPYWDPLLDTPSLNKYKRVVDDWGDWDLFQLLLRAVKKVATKHGVSISTVAVRYILDKQAVAGSMIGVRLGLSEHIRDSQAIFKVQLDDEDRQSMEAVTSKGRDMFDVLGDCGNEYRQ